MISQSFFNFVWYKRAISELIIMSNKIKNIGSIQKLDGEGFIINNLSLRNLQQAYKPIIEEVISLYQSYFPEILHSVYLRGSVAKGTAVAQIADVDSMALTTRKLTKEEQEKASEIWKIIEAKYDFITGLEVFVVGLEEVENSKPLQFLLKTQCLCVFGEDHTAILPKCKIGSKASYAHSFTLKEDLKKLHDWRQEGEDEKELCSWIMKRIVRVGFELVMVREVCFTRDLYPCYELFTKHYPEKSIEMLDALKLAVFPIDDPQKTDVVIEKTTPFLLEQIAQIDTKQLLS